MTLLDEYRNTDWGKSLDDTGAGYSSLAVLMIRAGASFSKVVEPTVAQHTAEFRFRSGFDGGNVNSTTPEFAENIKRMEHLSLHPLDSPTTATGALIQGQ
jgi:hypothetical protein